jgi:ribosomal protein L16 Arg81 hydroxylase
VPDYCALSADDDGCPVDINAWFGPKGTISPLHQDAKHNLLAQVVGTKYLRLFHTSLTDRLYPHSSHLLSTTSRVDVDNPDLEQFPLFEGLEFSDCVLQEGDLLYLPPMYWHYVRSLSVSFSVSFWWQ